VFVCVCVCRCVFYACNCDVDVSDDSSSAAATSVTDATSTPICCIIIGMAGSGKTTLLQVHDMPGLNAMSRLVADLRVCVAFEYACASTRDPKLHNQFGSSLHQSAIRGQYRHP